MIQFSWKDKHATPPAPCRLRTEKLITQSGHEENEITGEFIHGDNFSILSALLETHTEQIDLIYIDPPFFTNRKFSARVGRGEDSRKPKDWQLDHGYGDTWNDLDAYIQFLYDRLLLAYKLLKPTGTIYLHLDWHADAYARLLMDEIFGAERLLNEIIWTYHGPSPIRSAFNRKHDTILSYTKTENYTFNVDDVRTEYSQNTVKTFKSSSKAGFGKVPDLERGKVPEDWWYFPVVARLHSERTGYPTQKPEQLVERVIRASSNPGDLVLDFFSGSGTTAAVAARNNRRFIAVDASSKAIHIAQERSARDKTKNFAVLTTDAARKPIEDRNDLVQIDQDLAHLRSENDVFMWEIGYNTADSVFVSLDQRSRPYRTTGLEQWMRVPEGKVDLVVRVTMLDDSVRQQVMDRRSA